MFINKAVLNTVMNGSDVHILEKRKYLKKIQWLVVCDLTPMSFMYPKEPIQLGKK